MLTRSRVPLKIHHRRNSDVVRKSSLQQVKDYFPLFKNHAPPFVYLDNAATTQKPQVVLDALTKFYARDNSNIHRGMYTLSERATEKYEHARVQVAKFINAASPREIIFAKNTTEAINLVAYTWGEEHIKAGDEIVVSVAEHHSNFVPWLLLARRKKALLKVAPLSADGRITAESIAGQLSKKTKLLAIHHVSNVLGAIAPLEEVIGIAKKQGVMVLVDAAQSIAHMPVNVRMLQCDWLAFSGHKMYGPTGVGVLYGREEVLSCMPPFIAGGGTIKEVGLDKVDFADPPQKFEGGTPPIAEVIGLEAAIAFIDKLGFKAIKKHEADLLSYALTALSGIKKLQAYGPEDKAVCTSIISFNLEGIHSHDVASLVNEKGVALRAGFHCAQPLMQALGILTTCRISFAVYNTREDIDRLVSALQYAQELLG